MLEGKSRSQFEQLHALGMEAKNTGDPQAALGFFEQADQLAITHDDDRKRLDALQPAARALWSSERYTEATEKLQTAATIAEQLNLPDEQGMILSNLGRIAATAVMSTTAPGDQPAALRERAVPKFKQAFEKLKDHPHFYFRYANAEHGSVVAALASDRRLAGRLTLDGLKAAFRRSPEPYDQRRTFRINHTGLGGLAMGTALIPFGNKTPVLAKVARTKFVR